MFKNKKLQIIITLIILMIFVSGCGQKENYNYNRLNVQTVVDNELLTEQFDEAYSTVYFFPKTETKSYLYIIKETNRDEYSIDTAAEYLSTMKDILKNGYQMSKKEIPSSKKIKNQFICTNEYSAMDVNENIYTAKTKYIYDTETKEALMIICFVDDKEDKATKEAFYKIFNTVKLNKPSEKIEEN